MSSYVDFFWDFGMIVGLLHDHRAVLAVWLVSGEIGAVLGGSIAVGVEFRAGRIVQADLFSAQRIG